MKMRLEIKNHDLLLQGSPLDPLPCTERELYKWCLLNSEPTTSIVPVEPPRLIIVNEPCQLIVEG